MYQKRSRARRGYGEGSITQNSRGLWVGRIELGTGADQDGNPVRRRLEKASKNQRTVLDWIAKTRAEILANGRSADPRVTVAAFANGWLQRKAHAVRPGAMSTYRAVVANWIVPTIGAKQLGKVTPADVRAVTDAMRAAGRSPRYMHSGHVILGNMLQDAVRDGIITDNPQRRVKAPKTFPGDRWAFTREQSRAVIAAAAQAELTRPIAALLTGMRQSELLGLTWESVHLEVGEISVAWQLRDITHVHGCGARKGNAWPCGRRRGMDCPKGSLPMPDGMPARHLVGAWWLIPPKTGKVRTVPIHPALEVVLRKLAADTRPNPYGLVWRRDDGRPILPREDEQEWRSIVLAAGLPAEATTHFARHTAASLLLGAQVDAKVVGEILGHNSVELTRGTYQHVSSELARAGMNRLGELLADG